MQLLNNVKSARKEVISHPERWAFEVYVWKRGHTKMCVCVCVLFPLYCVEESSSWVGSTTKSDILTSYITSLRQTPPHHAHTHTHMHKHASPTLTQLTPHLPKMAPLAVLLLLKLAWRWPENIGYIPTNMQQHFYRWLFYARRKWLKIQPLFASQGWSKLTVSLYRLSEWQTCTHTLCGL